MNFTIIKLFHFHRILQEIRDPLIRLADCAQFPSTHCDINWLQRYHAPEKNKVIVKYVHSALHRRAPTFSLIHQATHVSDDSFTLKSCKNGILLLPSQSVKPYTQWHAVLIKTKIRSLTAANPDFLGCWCEVQADVGG